MNTHPLKILIILTKKLAKNSKIKSVEFTATGERKQETRIVVIIHLK